MPLTKTQLSAFKSEILSLADTLKHLNDLKYGRVTPARASADLLKLEKALTIAIQQLIALDLCHEVGQDLETRPYNFPLVSDLQHMRCYVEWVKRRVSYDVCNEDPTYPTKLIGEIVALRDAAREANKNKNRKPGNNSAHDPNIQVKWELARNMVFRYRSNFSVSPPTTKDGSSGLVELLEQAFERAGTDNSGASHWLRKAVKHFQGVVKLPRQNRAKSVKS